MASLHLHVPRQVLDRSTFIDLRPSRMQGWIANLPTANIEKTAEKTLFALTEANRVRMSGEHREQLLEMFRPVVDQVTATLKKTYAVTPIPVPRKYAPLARMVQQLYEQLANGYKILAREALRSGKESSANRQVFITLRPVLRYLSLRLVESYHLYGPEPTGVWSELHLVYLLAERQGIHRLVQPPREGLPRQTSIEHGYKRILLLALSNPYQLMQGEALELYEQFDAWASHCRLLPLSPGQTLSQCFFVDFIADAPPNYASARSSFQPMQGRIIDTAPLVPLFQHLLYGRTTFPLDGEMAARTTLVDRMRRQMYARLATALRIPRPERIERRTLRRANLYMVSGLSTCHQLYSGKLRVVIGADADSGSAADGGQPQDGASPSPSEVFAHPTSATVPGGIEVEGEEGAEDSVFTPLEEQVCLATPWLQRDESNGGLGLFSFGKSPPRVQVGEVIAFGEQEPKEGHPWRLGIIRWVRVRSNEGLELGVEHLEVNARSVLTRAETGVGKGGRSYRSLILLTPSLKQPPMLLTPPGIYDEGTELTIEIGPNRSRRVRLTKLIEATSRYAQYNFTELKQPAAAGGGRLGINLG